MTEEKLLRISIALIVGASPLFFWLILYLANPQSQDELRTEISRIKRLRWITYLAGIAFLLFCLVDHLSARYWSFGSGIVTASIGLEIPASWLRKRLARAEQQTISSPNAILHLG
jgi:hypothetical protein